MFSVTKASNVVFDALEPLFDQQDFIESLVGQIATNF